jgi:hypothetical protein
MTELTTYSAAIALMEDRAQSGWLALSSTFTDMAEIRSPANELTFGKAPLDKIWSRISTQNVQGTKTTVGSDINGRARYTYNGLLFIQIFGSMHMPGFPIVGRLIAEGMRNVFRSSPMSDSVVYRNARIDEMTNDNTFYQYRVICEYEFDELG